MSDFSLAIIQYYYNTSFANRQVFSVEYFLLKKRLKMANNGDDGDELVECLSLAERCLWYLSECRRCLAHEREGTFEHQVATAAAGRCRRECAELAEVLRLMNRHCREQTKEEEAE